MLMPWLLIIIGLIFLSENLDLIPAVEWPIIWPIILILAGLYLMKKKSGQNCCGWPGGKEEKK